MTSLKVGISRFRDSRTAIFLELPEQQGRCLLEMRFLRILAGSGDDYGNVYVHKNYY